MDKPKSCLPASLSGVAGAVILCGSALAQVPSAATPTSEDQNVLKDIIVTAQRKSERLQEVPIAVNVISGEALTERGISNSEDLPALVPGLTFTTTGPAGTVFLRGIGSNAGNPNDEPSVATYVDGVYIASSFSNQLNLVNIDHVEVLKGPQGTLFGRNATGGVIQVITRDPQQTPSIEVTGGYGNYDTGSGSLYATTGITDNLAVDISAQGSDQSKGWGYNAITQRETYETQTYSLRSKVLFTPLDNFRATLSGDYSYTSSNMVDYRLPPGVRGIDGQLSPAGLYDTRTDIIYDNLKTPLVVTRTYGTSLNLNYDAGFADLVSISAYRHATGVYHAEADGTPLQVVEAVLPIYQRNFSQELQMLSPKSSLIDWTLGVYYFDNNAGYQGLDFTGLAFGNPPFSAVGLFQETGIEHTQSVAEYAQVGVPLGYNTKLTLGARYTDEKQRSETTVFNEPIPDHSIGFRRPTWRVAVDHAFTDDEHAYVSYNRGVKGGGFDLLTPGSTGFQPEVVDAYEIGFKSQFLERRVRFNPSVFDYEYKNIQVQVIPAGTGGIISTTNAAKARIRGIDFDAEAVPIDHLTLSFGFAYIDGKYLDFKNTVAYTASPLDPRPSYCSEPTPGTPCLIDASGNPTIRTPKTSGNLTAAYEFVSAIGRFPLSVTGSHNGGFSFSADDRLRQPSYTLLNASGSWMSLDGHYDVTFWGSNLTNKYYLAQGVPSALGDLTSPAPPRTYGATFKVKFGG